MVHQAGRKDILQAYIKVESDAFLEFWNLGPFLISLEI
jgi:hypothetical protein